jgi:hypothetical protein
MSVGTTHPIGVNVDDELRHRCTTKKQVVVKGALEVAEDPLREMVLLRVVHVEAHLLDRVDVGPGDGEVLESPDQAAVGSRVADGGR